MNKSKKTKFISIKEAQKVPLKQAIQEIEDLNSRIEGLEKSIKDIEQDTKRIQKQTEKISNFTITIVLGVAVVVGMAFIEISFDYLRNNEERYEKFIEKTEEIKNDFYTKEQLRLPLNNIDRTTKFLDCSKAKGYFSVHCFQ